MIVPARPGPGWPHNPSKGRRPTNTRAPCHVDPHEDGRVVAARNQSRAKTRAMLNPMDWTQPALERHRPQELASRRGDRRRVVLAAARKPSPRPGHFWIGQEPIAAPEARRGHPSSHDTAAGPFLEPKERLIICAPPFIHPNTPVETHPNGRAQLFTQYFVSCSGSCSDSCPCDGSCSCSSRWALGHARSWLAAARSTYLTK